MDTRTKGLLMQIIAGIITVVLGGMTCAYGYCFLTGRIVGSVKVCVLLLGMCLASLVICAILAFRNLVLGNKTDEE